MADEEDLMQDEAFERKLAAVEKKTKLLLVLLAVAILLAIGSGAYAHMTVSGLQKQVASAKAVVERVDSGKEDPVKPTGEATPVGVIHPLGNFVVNLLDPGNLRYVNCRIEVEVGEGDVVKQINTREAQFKDAVISLLGSKTYEDVIGFEGKARVREELMVRFNRLLDEGHIARIYLTEFVVQ